MINEIVSNIKKACKKAKVPMPNIYTEFADAITSSKKTNYTFPDIEDGVKGIKFMFAAKNSSNKNCKV